MTNHTGADIGLGVAVATLSLLQVASIIATVYLFVALRKLKVMPKAADECNDIEK